LISFWSIENRLISHFESRTISGFWCTYSTPICWQYSIQMFYISVRVQGTLSFYLRQKTVFKSADESPKFDIKCWLKSPSFSYGLFCKQNSRRYPSISFNTLNFLWSFCPDHSQISREELHCFVLGFPHYKFHPKSKPWKKLPTWLTLSDFLGIDRIIVRKICMCCV
jgi:hypothetical protein